MDDLHIHTKLTDGSASPEEIINLACELGVKTIAFTEHISKTPTYDWFKFRDVVRAVDSRGVKVLVGVEAKVLTESGDLDVSDEVHYAADLVLGSCHSIGKVEWLLNADCDIIAHPQIDSSNLDLFLDCGKVLEINSKHRLATEILDRLVRGGGNVFSFGSDTHRLGDFGLAQAYFAQILSRYPSLRLLDVFER